MRKIIPFYSNTLDNVHCYQSALRMVLKYFLPNKEFLWKKLEKMTNFHKDLWTWPMAGILSLHKMGFDVINMEDFDYEKFASLGEKYLFERVDKNVAEEQIKHSDISGEAAYAEEFVRLFGKQIHVPTDQDIKRLLSKGYLVICNVNGKILNGEKGYEGHFVLIFGFDENNFYLQDPGLPPMENAKIPFTRFNQAWAYPTEREKTLIGFKYSLKLH